MLGDGRGNSQIADRSSAGLLPSAAFLPGRRHQGLRRPHPAMAQHLRGPHLDRHEGEGCGQL